MSSRFEIGMKVYDNDWFLKYNLSYREAAEMLHSWGVTYVLAQSKYLLMPDSAVKSEVPPELKEKYAAYSDRKFRDALAEVGIQYYAALCLFFDPPALAKNPAFRPVGNDGRNMEKIDWYVGITPSQEDHVAQKISDVSAAVQALEPDGVFSTFTRWPGFWELWMPGAGRKDYPEFSYDPNSLLSFSHDTGIRPPSDDAAQAALWIENNAREAWTEWKCNTIFNILKRMKAEAGKYKPDIRLMLNTLAFGKNDFDDAVRKVFGQSFEKLSNVVDVFEVMTYHQILKKPVDWIAQIGEEVKSRTGKTTLCTLQAAPLYLEGMHARENRSRTLNLDEFDRAVQAVVDSRSIDGMVVFVWSDFLRQMFDQKDSRRVDILKKAAASR